jgi:hypothetical protein
MHDGQRPSRQIVPDAGHQYVDVFSMLRRDVKTHRLSVSENVVALPQMRCLLRAFERLRSHGEITKLLVIQLDIIATYIKS